MEYKDFLKVGLGLQKAVDRSRKLYELNVDLIEFETDYHNIIDTLLKQIYTEEGCDWFDWYCWENDFGRGTLTAQDKDGNPICYSWETLYEELKNHKK